MPGIVVTAGTFDLSCPEVRRCLEEGGFDRIEGEKEHRLNASSSEEAVFEAAEGFEAAIAGRETYSRAVLEKLAASGLRMISRCGVGCDTIDTDACREFGITLARAVGSVEGAVAEHVMASVLYFAKQMHLQNEEMQRGVWSSRSVPGAKTRTIGLVGFGGIGQEIARRAAAFDMKILYFCRHRVPEAEKKYGAVYADFDALLSQSDYVSVNVPLTPETRGMFGRAEFARMKEGAVFINIARGPVADYAALAENLKNGHLSGAAADVFDREPCTDSVLRGCPNTLLTPHSATHTEENSLTKSLITAENAVKWLNGTLSGKAKAV